MRADHHHSELTLLGQAGPFRYTGSRLVLFDGGGNESLLYERTVD